MVVIQTEKKLCKTIKNSWLKAIWTEQQHENKTDASTAAIIIYRSLNGCSVSLVLLLVFARSNVCVLIWVVPAAKIIIISFYNIIHFHFAFVFACLLLLSTVFSSCWLPMRKRYAKSVSFVPTNTVAAVATMCKSWICVFV